MDRFTQPAIGADGAGPNPDTIGEALQDSGRNPHALVGYAQGVELGTIILINIHHAQTGEGNDTLIGNNSNNNLNGGPGDDYFVPWFGTDNLEGGPGVDTVDYRYFDGRTIVDLHNSYATWPDNPGPFVFDNVIGFENALTGPANDQLLGNKKANDLWAGAGKDILRGAGANDWLHGENGNDRLWGDEGDEKLEGGADNNNHYGGEDDDKLYGNSGNDILTGGTGRDMLWGGSGKDDFDFNSIKESKTGSSRDQIKDFKRGDDDIDLSNIDANTKKGGNQKFSFIGNKDFSKTPGELRFDDKTVQSDVNGDGKADFEIRVDLNKLSSGDFIL